MYFKLIAVSIPVLSDLGYLGSTAYRLNRESTFFENAYKNSMQKEYSKLAKQHYKYRSTYPYTCTTIGCINAPTQPIYDKNGTLSIYTCSRCLNGQTAPIH